MTIQDEIQLDMAMEEFIQLYHEAPFELIDGKRIPVMPGVSRHSEAIRTLFRMMDHFTQVNDLGEVFNEVPYILAYDSNWVKGSRVPDVMFFSKARFEIYKAETPDRGDKPHILVPDLVIEIVSPNDSFSEINTKVMRYRADGVRLIWVIDPQERNAYVFALGQPTDIRFENDTLSGGDVVPGFMLELKKIFQQQ